MLVQNVSASNLHRHINGADLPREVLRDNVLDIECVFPCPCFLWFPAQSAGTYARALLVR